MKTPIIKSSNNDEYYTPRYAVYPILEFIKPKSRVWCPFDTEESNFVKILRQAGHRVVCTHISDGQDFFKQDADCDVIVSNPPYSLKFELFERLFKLNKPFAMLVNETALFGSKKRFDLFRDKQFELLQLGGRVEYFKDYDQQVSCGSSPFRSIYVCSGVLPQNMIFRDLNKNCLLYTSPSPRDS